MPMGLILASAGKAVSQNGGLSGGHPGNTGLDVVARRSRIAELLASGRMPAQLAEISDTLEPAQNYASSYLAPGEVFAMTWQGGGGYGDPLTREPAAVARDLREQKITAAAARDMYGAVLVAGQVDEGATAAERAARRSGRKDRSRPLRKPNVTAVDVSAARRLDDNLVEANGPHGPVVACRHCGQVLADGPADAPADGPADGPADHEGAEGLAVAVYEGPPADAGPQILTNPSDYVDAPVVFRQYCCPGCWTALYSAVVPADHTDTVGGLAPLAPFTTAG
jgi:N-methylhydantoinase B